MIVRQPVTVCMHRRPICRVRVRRNVLRGVRVHHPEGRQEDLGDRQQRYWNSGWNREMATTARVTGLRCELHGGRGYH